MFRTTGVPIPALRGHQGGRTFYLTLPTNKVLNNFFPRDMETDPASVRSQRPYDPNRAKQIGQYMADNEDEYVLGALTYAMDVPGSFTEVEPGSDIGVLTIPLDARLRSTDGQHRRGGIKDALDAAEKLGSDHTALLIYVEPDLQKRRQMFSDMNWHQKPVSKSVNVGFDRRDPFARVTQRLVSENPLLQDRVETERASVGWSSEKLFTQGAIYDALSRCVAGVGGRVRNRDRWEDRDDELFKIGTDFFDMLVLARGEFAQIVRGESTAPQVRADSILVSSTTLRAIAGAYFLARRAGFAAGDLVTGLSLLDFSPKNRQWQKIGFVTPGRSTPNARLQEVKAATEMIAGAIIPTSGEDT
ncbi:MAG TPA: DNA sulfur modification protein DndB [Vicinamibacterales bacterium]|jgi:DNA sulfur modification protein DndB